MARRTRRWAPSWRGCGRISPATLGLALLLLWAAPAYATPKLGPPPDAGPTEAPDAGAVAVDVAPVEDVAPACDPCPDCVACEECPECPVCPTEADLDCPAKRGRCLEARLAPLVDAAPLSSTAFGALVARLSDGAVLFARRARDRFVPASSTKIITAAAALHRLGPAYQFETEILSDARRGARIVGNLYVKGFGDPMFDRATLLMLADAIRERGIKRITGGVVADGSAFDDEHLPPHFDRKKTDATYRPAVGALAVHRGTVRVAIYPGNAPGEPCRVELGLGAGYIDLRNSCSTVGGRTSKVRLSTEASGRRTRAVVGGSLGVSAGRVVSSRRVEEPLLHAAHAFQEALQRVGVRVDGAPSTGTTPGRRTKLLTHRSPPLATVLLEMNKISDNFIAEMVLKTLGGEVEGWPATWEKGQSVVRRYLRGMDSVGEAFDDDALSAPGLFTEDSFVFLNGSGLYDGNRFSPAQLVRVLRAAAMRPETGADFVASLAIAGLDGTLRRRLKKTRAVGRARGKTGTLNGVDALAGIVTAHDGETYLFAFLAGEHRAAHKTIRKALDRLLEAISKGCE